LVHVPCRRGAPALTDLIGGHVQAYFASTASSIDTSSRQGAAVGGNPRSTFGRLVAEETEKGGKVIKLASIKPE
jgi:hypothetical protein